MTRGQMARLGFLGCDGRPCACAPQLGFLGATQPKAIISYAAPAAGKGTLTTQAGVSTSSSPAAPAADSVQAIIAAICPQGITAGNCGCSTDTANVQTLFQNSITSLYLMWPPPDPSWANCSGVSSTTGTQKAGAIASAAGGLTAAGAVAAGAAVGSAVPVIGTLVGAGVGLVLGLIGGSHAKAVAAQNSALCTAVPEFNSALQQIDSGQVAASTATYQQLAAQFQAAMQAGTSYKKCDALYAYNLAAQMVIAARVANLTGGSATASLAGLPSWAWIAAAIAGLWLLL